METDQRHKKDRRIFANNMALARYAEKMMAKQRKELGLPDPPMKIGNVTELRFRPRPESSPEVPDARS